MDKIVHHLLLVEDDEGDVFLMERALQKVQAENMLRIVSDGKMAIEYLSGIGEFSDRSRFPIPSVVFLDLKLPFKDGFEVLRWIRATSYLSHVRVVVLTSSDETRDRELVHQLGASHYLVKPPTAKMLLEVFSSMKVL